MLRNYIKIAWRNLLKNKLFSLINVFGLAIGITCCAMIYIYVRNELSYDAYHQKADRIFRITTEAHEPKKINHFAPSSSMMALRIKANFPEVEHITRIESSKRTLSAGDKKSFDTKLLWADSTLFDLFSFDMTDGNPAKALAKPYSIVLTQSAAKRFFGDTPAFGRSINLSDSIGFLVTGIIKDVPLNSHFTFDAVLSRNTLDELNKNNPDWKSQMEADWFNCSLYSYLLLAEHHDPKELENKINKVFQKEMADVTRSTGMTMNVRLQPIRDIHLRSHLEAEFRGSTQGDILYVYIFSAVALLVLLIACCNFINLSTARSLNRAKEIGLRKVVGATRSELIWQFLGESVLYALLAGCLSLLLLLVLVPLFNALLGSSLRPSLSMFWIYPVIISCAGFIAGLYPAFLMSSFVPVRSLKGMVKHGLSDILFRKGLVVFQFTIAVVLIIGTSLILKQLDYIQSRNLGMNKEHLVSIELKPPDVKRRDVILKEIANEPYVSGLTINGFSFKGISKITLLPEGIAQNELTSCSVFSADENFLPTFGISMVAGRNFSGSIPGDVREAFIVNEAAVKAFGWKTPKEAIGKRIEWAFGKSGTVIGVVKDFNYASLKESIQPLLIHIFPPWFNTLTVRLKEGDVKSNLSKLEAAWKKTGTDSPFKYTFVEDDFNNLYKSELTLRNLLTAFTVLALLVACLGLFGLAAFSIKQRFKEIGIRKVLGSGTGKIVSLLTTDFLKLVLIAIFAGSPIAYFGFKKWLQNFAYQTDTGWLIFFSAAAIAMLIAFLTVSIQAFRAASSNPVKSLRTE